MQLQTQFDASEYDSSIDCLALYQEHHRLWDVLRATGMTDNEISNEIDKEMQRTFR